MTDFRKIDIGWGSLWRIAAFAGVLFVLYEARAVVGIFVISIVISLGLDPFVSFLERLKFPRLLGSILAFLIGLLILGVGIYFIIPLAIEEVGHFITYTNKHLATVFDGKLPQFSFADIERSITEAIGFLGFSSAAITGAISTFFMRATLVVATVMMSFYFTVEKDGPERLIRAILPEPYERSTLAIFSNFKIKIRKWFSAQLLLSVIVGTIVSAGLWILGVRYALVIGILAAVFELVPMIGPVIAGAAAFLVAITDSFSLSVYALAFFMLVQQLENHVLVPLVMGRAVKVHPIMAIVSILAGGYIAGFVGIVLAVPVAVLIQEVFAYVAEQRKHKPALGI